MKEQTLVIGICPTSLLMKMIMNPNRARIVSDENTCLTNQLDDLTYIVGGLLSLEDTALGSKPQQFH